ncbi:MAG: peptidase C39 family protein [Candidatus Aenigmarchaeota archaeon]|nr:peptidase C39 family protein [Candidatus Aenigmarchaeota archaeon]
MKYEQFTPEGCLPVCLLKAAGIRPGKEKEIKSLMHAFRLTKFDYALGNVDFFVKKYKKKVSMIVENESYADFLKKLSTGKNLVITSKKISKNVIDEHLLLGNVIIYLDAFYVGSSVHVPHFVVITGRKRRVYIVLDPWDGKTKTMPPDKLLKGVDELKKRFYFTPKLIQVDE